MKRKASNMEDSGKTGKENLTNNGNKKRILNGEIKTGSISKKSKMVATPSTKISGNHKKISATSTAVTAPTQTKKEQMEGPMVRKYELISVMDKRHKNEVDAKINCRKVNDENNDFNDVRRNKKIQKLLNSKEPVRNVLSSKQNLNVIPKKFHGKGIYDKKVIDVLQHPENFAFIEIEKGQPRWNVHEKKKQSQSGNKMDLEDNIEIADNYLKPVILTTDYSQEDLMEMKNALEQDMGVLKLSVEQLVSRPFSDLLPITTHPGHHAGPNQIANYCIINNSIVTASLIKQHKPRQKIGILDLDAHPGDGTKQLIMKNKELVDQYFSLHTDEEFDHMDTFHDQSKAIVFPRHKSIRGRKRNISWEEYAHKLSGCLGKLSKTKLNVLIVCIGFDTLKADPIAGIEIGFQLMPVHFRKIGAMLAQLDLQVLFVQEGGYDTNLTASAFENLVSGFQTGRKYHSITLI